MALEIASTTMTTETMDHHGLIAGICQKLTLADRINARIGSLGSPTNHSTRDRRKRDDYQWVRVRQSSTVFNASVFSK